MAVCRIVSRLVLIVGLVITTACRQQSESSAEGVASPATPSGAENGVGWSVSAEPKLHVGAGPDGPTFGWVSGVTILSNGAIVVADNMQKVLHFFGPDGTYMRTMGGPGEGPGEFKSVSQVHSAAGDTIIVNDQLTRRISFFDPSGTYIRSFRPEFSRTDELTLLGILGGDLLIQMAAARGRQEGLSRDTMLVGLASTDSGFVIPLKHVLGEEYVVTNTANGLRMRRAPFARATRLAAAKNRYAIGFSDVDSIVVFDTAHHVLFSIPRGERTIAPVKRSDVRRYYTATRPAGSDIGAYLRRSGNPNVAPTRMPAFGKLLFDSDLNLWAQRYSPPWNTETATWDVYDTSGRPIGDVRFPFDAEILVIGRDYLVAVLTDSAEVQTVGVFALSKQVTN